MEKALRAKKGLTVGVGKDEDLSIEIDIGSGDNPHIKYNTTTDKFEISEDGTTYVEVSKDENVKVSSADTTTGYLEDKIGGKTGEITLIKQDVGADESIEISLDSTLKTNYDNSYSHSITTTGNPHQVTKTDVGLGNVVNTDTTNADNIADGLTNAIITLTQETNFETAYSKSHDQNTDTGTDSDDFSIGDGTDTDKTISIDNGDVNSPQLKYDSATNKWQYSNDGVTFTDIGSGGSGSAEVVYLEVTQVAHGFDNDFVYNNGTTWVKAQADDENTTATHFAVRVTDDIFNAVIIGEVDITGLTDDDSQALTNNTFYFLSQTVAGKLATIEPTTGIKQVVMKTNTTNNATISIEIPFDLAEPSNLAYTDIANTFTAGQTISVDTETALSVQNSDGTSTIFNVDTVANRVGVGTNTPNSTLQVLNTTLSKSVVSDTELLLNGGFVGNADNWTLGAGWSYGTNNIILDNTNATRGTVTQPITVTTDLRYVVTWTQTNSEIGNALIRPSIGSGSENPVFVANPTSTSATTFTQVIQSKQTGTVNLTFTVQDVTNTGTVTITNISVKEISQADSVGSFNGQTLRSFNGDFGNLGLGSASLGRLTTGTNNTAVGGSALFFNTTGSSNTGIGTSALRNNSTGSGNTAVGREALIRNTTGNNNVALGVGSARENSSGSENTVVGVSALRNNLIGSGNTAVGRSAGFYTSSGANLTKTDNSIFLGNDARPKADNEINQIVIGHMGRGNGSNTITIGNDGITDTYLKGNIRASKVAPTTDSTTAFQITKADGTTEIFNVDSTNGNVGFAGKVLIGTSYTAPVTDNEVATKKYVDDNSGGGASLTQLQNFFGLLANRPSTPFYGNTANGTTTIRTVPASSKSFFTFAFTNTDTVARVVNLLVDDVIIYSQELNAGETADLADIFAQPYLVADTTIKISSTVTTITYHINVIDVLDTDLTGFFMYVGSCTGSEQTIRTSGASTKSKILGECYCNPTTTTTYTISNKYNNVAYLSSKTVPAYNCVYLMNQGKTITSSSTLKITGNNANVKYLIFGFEG